MFLSVLLIVGIECVKSHCEMENPFSVLGQEIDHSITDGWHLYHLLHKFCWVTRSVFVRYCYSAAFVCKSKVNEF